MTAQKDQSQKKSARNLKILSILLENLAEGPRVQERALLKLRTYKRIHLKSCCILPLKVAATLLSGSRKGAVEA